MDVSYFDNVIGQCAVKEKLLHWVRTDHVPHALIFSGPDGVGKTTLACAFAEIIVQHPVFTGGIPVLQDRAYAAFGSEVYFIAPQTSQLKVEQFRQVREKLFLGNVANHSRVCIIDHGETMNAAFANGMLTILEEPPQGVIFIIITNQPERLLTTVRSRCVECMLAPVAEAALRQALAAAYPQSPEKREKAVRAAAGNVARAYEIMAGDEKDYFQEAVDFLQIIAEHAAPYTKLQFLCAAWDKREVLLFLQNLLLFIRDAAVWEQTEDRNLLQQVQAVAALRQAALTWRLSQLLAMEQVAEECRRAILLNVNVRLVIDYLCIQCIRIKGGI